MPEAAINGARIHYERAGAGLPLIFLHAGVADARMWEPQLHEFAKHFDVVCPDTRGFGGSEPPSGRWSPVADLLALIDRLHEKPVHLVGCSMGGGIAIDFALQHGQRISRLVLVSSAVGGQLDAEASTADELDPPAIERLSEISAPTLVVVGDKDVPDVLEVADILVDKVPHARKAVIADAAHLPNLERPQEFNRIVLEFLLAG